MVNCVLLYAAAGAASVAMAKISPTAGLFMVPYMAWLSLATALNFSLWRNNPSAPDKKED